MTATATNSTAMGSSEACAAIEIMKIKAKMTPSGGHLLDSQKSPSAAADGPPQKRALF